MDKSLAYRFIALSMAMLIMVFATVTSVDFHYCKGELKNISLIGQAKSCHELAAASTNTCHKSEAKCQNEKPTKLTGLDCKDNCCNNVLVDVETEDQQLPSQILQLERLQIAVLLPLLPFDYNIENATISTPEYLHFKPPLSGKDILPLVQSYLI